ncbi:MAG: biopolymer transporter ExbD [Anaeromyxobacter sp.]|nr:biopolymer transporter ExbD [Anaeromyxobacter sp.]MBL0277228.1 biopolymer transporter ExbD [Anaeromyxobacter sp.]
MAGHGPPDSSGIVTGINVTPLVDITLVLLIIFIVTAKIVVAPAVPLDLPRASTSEELQVVLSVVVPASGPVLVDGVAMPDRAALRARASVALARDADVRAVINADGATPHRRVVEALDLLREVGIARVAFGALPLEEPAR